jgi:predicted phosphodiesterase
MVKRRQFLLATLIAVALWFACLISGQNSPLTFVVYGDTRTGHDVHKAIVAQILKFRPAFVLCTGDLVSRGTEADQWETFFQIIKPILDAKILYIPVKGNHDRDGETGLYAKAVERLGLKPDTGNPNYFSVRFSNVCVFVLDSNTILEDDAQLRWLEKAVSECKGLHKFVAFHHPLFTLIERRAAEAERFRQRLQPLLDHLKVCAVFVGHDHHFYCTKRQGITYVTTGGGGAPLYDLDPKLAQEGDSFLKAYHFIVVEVSGHKALATVIGMDGEKAKLEGKSENPFALCDHSGG